MCTYVARYVVQFDVKWSLHTLKRACMYTYIHLKLHIHARIYAYSHVWIDTYKPQVDHVHSVKTLKLASIILQHTTHTHTHIFWFTCTYKYSQADHAHHAGTLKIASIILQLTHTCSYAHAHTNTSQADHAHRAGTLKIVSPVYRKVQQVTGSAPLKWFRKVTEAVAESVCLFVQCVCVCERTYGDPAQSAASVLWNDSEQLLRQLQGLYAASDWLRSCVLQDSPTAWCHNNLVQ
jgi:hypothetical protein